MVPNEELDILLNLNFQREDSRTNAWSQLPRCPLYGSSTIAI